MSSIYDSFKNLKIGQSQESGLKSQIIDKESDFLKLSLNELIPFPQNPFRKYNLEELEELAQSIKQNGLLVPIIARPYSGKYQIISGHNRVEASKLLELSEVPVIVKSLTDDEAAIVLVETNLASRPYFLPSEKAFAYKMKMEALSHQGQRTSRQIVGKLETSDVIGKDTNESGRQIQRYIRLTYLIPQFLQMVDENKLPLMAGYNLSFTTRNNQELIYSFFKDNNISIDIKISEIIKNQECISQDFLQGLISIEEIKEIKNVKIPFDRIKSFFKDESKKEIEEIIVKALEQYRGEAKY